MVTFFHRRTGSFLPGGGGGKPFAQKIFASCSNFYKIVEKKPGPMQQHRPYSFSGSIPAKSEHKLCRHKQTFAKIATTVVLQIKMKICCDQGCNDIGVVIATK